MNTKHRGIVVPMATPFTHEGRIDEEAVRRIVRSFVAVDIHCFVLGTTGEAPSIAHDERRRLVEIAVDEASGRILVYAGIGDNCTAQAIDAGNHHLQAGADAAVALLPSYYPLDGGEMKRHFELLAAKVDGPLVIYNIPSTTHLSIPVEVVAELSHLPNVVGFKDSENDIERMKTVAQQLGGREDFSLFMGVAANAAQALHLGFDGAVPGSGNVAPGLWRDLWTASQAGQWDAAEELQKRLDALNQIMQQKRSLGQMLAAIKAAMHGLGLCEPHMLPPLQALGPDEAQAVQAAIATFDFASPSA